MPFRRLITVCAVSGSFLSGCTSDLSRSTMYRDAVGQVAHLSKPQVLWRHTDHWGELAPYELESDFGTYSSNVRVGVVDPSTPLQIKAFRRRHYVLIHSPSHPHQDLAIVGLANPAGAGDVRAQVEVERLSLP